jgi:deazaflavin-dependent oxidoreductase (nitroreductase family)
MRDGRSRYALADRLARVARQPRCRLTHYGRKSGQPYEVTIWFLIDGEAVYLVTGDRRRQWVRNVLAHPAVQLRVRDETFAGKATPVTEPAEMTRVVELLKHSNSALATSFRPVPRTCSAVAWPRRPAGRSRP